MYLLYNSPSIGMAAIAISNSISNTPAKCDDAGGRGGTVEGAESGQHNAVMNRPEATNLGD